jgi:uncharacterized BrkB/YihY/UPF0761 family membrane protein
VLATTGLSALSSGAQSFAKSLHMAPGGRWLALLLSVALNIVLFVAGFRILTVRPVTTRDVVHGAVIAAVAWQVLQTVGTYYVAHKLKGSREIYGVFAVVLGLIAWIYLESVIIVLCAEFNVVVRNRLWPRSLMTPFTDKVQLTRADRQAYRSYARSQRFKGFQFIEVEFDQPLKAQGPTRPDGTRPRESEPARNAAEEEVGEAPVPPQL